MRFKLDEEEAFNDINYSMENYYQETILHIGSLSLEHINNLVAVAII